MKNRQKEGVRFRRRKENNVIVVSWVLVLDKIWRIKIGEVYKIGSKVLVLGYEIKLCKKNILCINDIRSKQASRVYGVFQKNRKGV